jgi:sugar/nucleoside kinase (ribokinase family)
MGAKIAGFKLGHRGFYVRTAKASALAALGTARPADPEAWACQEMWAPVFVVDVVGTTGAGDATIAGFLSALLRGMSLSEAVTAAVAVGACNVEAADALGGIRPWDETWRRVRGGWPRAQMHLDEPGWRKDTVSGHWVRETG